MQTVREYTPNKVFRLLSSVTPSVRVKNVLCFRHACSGTCRLNCSVKWDLEGQLSVWKCVMCIVCSSVWKFVGCKKCPSVQKCVVCKECGSVCYVECVLACGSVQRVLQHVEVCRVQRVLYSRVWKCVGCIVWKRVECKECSSMWKCVGCRGCSSGVDSHFSLGQKATSGCRLNFVRRIPRDQRCPAGLGTETYTLFNSCFRY